MNKKDNTYIEYLQNVVTNLPKNDEDSKKQKIYDILIAILILSPIIITPILTAFNYYLLGIAIIVICWGMCIIIGINKRKQINKAFYKIENAYTKFNIVNVEDVSVIKELYKDTISYRRAGGGITISGGEALVQHEFLEELLQVGERGHVREVQLVPGKHLPEPHCFLPARLVPGLGVEKHAILGHSVVTFGGLP